MSSTNRNTLVVLTIGATFFALAAVGCRQSEGESGVPAAEQSNAVVDDHSGWWCPEHGVPEAICAQCNTRLAAEFQKKGDWCTAHQRPESQCFICHQELEAKFAAQYEAKYGKQPPKPGSTDSGRSSDTST